MDLSLERHAWLLPRSSVESPLGRVTKETPRGSGRRALPYCERHKNQRRHLNMPGAHLDCPTGEPEDPCNSRGKAYTQGDDGAPPEPVLWVRRPAAALASTHAITPWGKLLLWTLAIIGCMDRPANAQGALTESGGSDTSAALAQAPTENLDAISHGPRLAGIHPSLFESARDTSGEVQNESLAAGEGKKRAKRRQSRKPLFSLKRQRKGSSKGTSQESLLAGQTEDSDATADISTTGSSESLAEGQGNKTKKGLLRMKLPLSSKKRRRRSSQGASRKALLPPYGNESETAAEESMPEGSSNESLTGGKDKKKKLKGLKRVKAANAWRKRGNNSPLSTSQENLPVSGSDESESEAVPKPGATKELPTERSKKKRSMLRAFRQKRNKKEGNEKQPIALGVVFDANGLAQISDIGRQALGNFATSASEQKEVYEAVEAATADGDSCLKAVVDIDPRTAGYFPHELQSVRQGLLIYEACQRLLDDLKKYSVGAEPNAILEGIASLPKPGSNVKILDDFLHASEPVFTVQAVEGQSASVDGFEQTVDVVKLIFAPNPVEVGFVDTALNGSWRTVESEDPDISARFLDFATQNGYGEALETGRKTGDFGGLLRSLKEHSSVFGIVVGVRQILGAPMPEYPSGKKAGKKWKDISVKHSMFTAFEAMKMIEILQTVLLQHALPGCLPLNATSLMMQTSLLLARLLEKFMAGSSLMGPEIGRNAQVRTQCLVGVFAELGLNAAPAENLSCYSHWRREQRLKGRHAYSPPAHIFSHLMRSVCSTEGAKGRKGGLLPVGSLSRCNSDCLVKAALRKDWSNKETEKHRKAYRLRRHDTIIGDALRMATFYSSDEILELDQAVAAAWLAGKLLLDAAREQTKSVESEAGPSSRAEPEPQQADSEGSRLSPGGVHALSSSETKSVSLVEVARKLTPKGPGLPIPSANVHPFAVGGNVNINAINMAATANVCRGLLETSLTNPMLFALNVLTNIRGYVNDSGAGIENTEAQRKLAKGSDVFSAMYKCFSCGLGGELLPPVFAPYASTAMQIGNFLRVDLEESRAFPWEKIVQTMGDGVFSTSAHASALKHLRKKASRFLEMFTPCMEEAEEASDLLMLSESAKRKLNFARRLQKALKITRGKRRRANGEMCEISGELQQLARLLVVWWVLGPSSSQSTQELTQSFQNTAVTFKNARFIFAFLVFNNGHNQAKIATEIVTAGCKNNKFVVPPGWAMGSKKGTRESHEVSFKDISKDISASFMYHESTLGSRGLSDWFLLLTAAQQLADACGQHPVVKLADLLSTDAGSSILTGYQCIKLQDEGVKLLSGVLGKRSKTVDKGYSHVLFQFLKGIDAWKEPKGSAELSQAFGRYSSTSAEADQQAVLAQWNGDFPNVDCAWKTNKRAQKAMIRKGTSYQKPARLPGKAAAKAMEFHCSAHAPLRLQDLAEVPQPAPTQFCAGDSSQCIAFEHSTEMHSRL